MKLNKLDHRVSHNMHTSGVERYIVTHRVPIWTQLPEHTPRQKAQAGSYLIFPNEIEFTLYTDQYYNSEETHCFIPKINALSKESEIVSKIIRIPKNEKNSFLLHLDSLGIDESTLFPDNLDIGCKRIKQRITLC